MAISVQNLIRERKYPFIISLSVFLITLIIFFFSSTTTLTSPFSSFSPSTTTNTPSPNTTTDQNPDQNNNTTSFAGDVNVAANNAEVAIEWKVCKGSVAVDYIPCLDNFKAIKELKSRRHMEHRERHCPNPSPRCLVPLPNGYKVPVLWPKSRDMVRVIH